MLDQVVEAMSGAWWTYLLLLGVCFGDAVLPLLPSETMVIAAGVLAAGGDLNLPLALAVAAAGAFLGDSCSYLLGRRLGSWASRILFRGRRGRRSLDWAHRTLQRRGVLLIAMARFVPGGRTATTFVAGTVSYPYPRFALGAGVGAGAWAVYNGLLGFVGGVAFQRQTWKGLLLSFGIAAAVVGLIELVGWLRRRRRSARTVRSGPDG
jgi:membrane-associated protein